MRSSTLLAGSAEGVQWRGRIHAVSVISIGDINYKTNMIERMYLFSEYINHDFKVCPDIVQPVVAGGQDLQGMITCSIGHEDKRECVGPHVFDVTTECSVDSSLVVVVVWLEGGRALSVHIRYI